jgi:hypothetical protein
LTRITNGPILWDIYDLVTIETQPWYWKTK